MVLFLLICCSFLLSLCVRAWLCFYYEWFSEVSTVKHVYALQYSLMKVPRQSFFCGSFLLFMFPVYLYYAVLSVSCSLVITSCERADLLALLRGVWWCFVFLSLSHVVFRARCSTWLYWFLILAFFLTSLGPLSRNMTRIPICWEEKWSTFRNVNFSIESIVKFLRNAWTWKNRLI